MMMRIGVLGSGKVGSALGAWAAACGYDVVFAAAHAESARAAAERAGNGARAAAAHELLASSELVLLALPFAAIAETLTPHRDLLGGTILVDATNPITHDRRALTIGHTDSGAETIARAFPASRVVKAFNATFAEVYAARRVAFGNARISICFAGDDPAAKAAVRALIETLGYDAVDAGPLVHARYLEPLSLLNIHLGRELGYGTDIGFALLRDAGD